MRVGESHIEWSPEAIEDLRAIRDYISQDNPSAAKALVLRIFDDVESLLQIFSEAGRPGRVAGTRELLISRSPFIAV